MTIVMCVYMWMRPTRKQILVSVPFCGMGKEKDHILIPFLEIYKRLNDQIQIKIKTN